MFGINKNGTKHKVGIIMPAFFPASRVTYDGGTVEEMLDGKVLASVTADGVKTWSELLQELGTNNVFNNVTYKSKLVLVSGTTKLIYQVRMIDSATIDFYAVNIEVASYFDSMKVKLENAGEYKNMAISSRGVITFNDYGGYAGTSGATLTIYK